MTAKRQRAIAKREKRKPSRQRVKARLRRERNQRIRESIRNRDVFDPFAATVDFIRSLGGHP